MSDTSYISFDQVKRYTYQFDEDKDAVVLAEIIPRASAIFDRLCEAPPAFFAKSDGTSSERVITGGGRSYLTLPIHAGLIEEIVAPSTYTLPVYREIGSALWLADTNGLIYPVGGPYTWWNGVGLTIKAKWGFEAVPLDVEEAVVELVIAIFRGKDHAFAKTIQLDNQLIVNEAIPKRTRIVAASYARSSGASAFV